MGIPMDFAYSKIFKSADISTISVKKKQQKPPFSSGISQPSFIRRQKQPLFVAGYSLAVVHGAGSFGHQHAKEQLGAEFT